VNDDLLPHVRNAREQVRIDVSEEKHALEKKNAGGPDIRSAAEVGKEHFANHGLAHEKKEGAQKERGSNDAYSQNESPTSNWKFQILRLLIYRKSEILEFPI